MAYKSLLLSLTLTAMLGYCLTVGLTSPNSIMKKVPEWTAIPFLILVFALYLLAAWWGFKGFSEHKMASIFSLGLCAFGLGLYALGFTMEMGRGKAAKGQYDYDFSKVDAAELATFTKLVEGAGLTLRDATFTEHWHLMEAAAGYRVCVQKGKITALNFSGKKVIDLALISQLTSVKDLYLNNCSLSDMSALHSGILDRLELADNRITDIKTLSGCPNVRWLVLKNNQLQSDDGIELFSKLVSKDLSGNPFSR